MKITRTPDLTIARGDDTLKSVVSYASKLTLTDLEDSLAIQAAPGIYQQYIEKKYEIRILYAGGDYLAARLHSQEQEDELVNTDWRWAGSRLKVDQIRLPAHVEVGLRHLFEELGLVTGSVDMFVTPDDEYIFLEVNESGQFLFLEAADPSIRTLSFFSQFLSEGNPSYIWDDKRDDISFSDFYRSDIYADFADKYYEAAELNSSPKLVDA